MDRQIKIYLKPHVYKFLVHDNNFGSDRVEIRKNNRFWQAFYPSMTRIKLDDELNEIIPAWFYQTSCCLIVEATFDFNSEVIDDITLVEIANILEESFVEALQNFVMGRIDAQKSIKESIVRFFDIYGIDENDFKLETAIKMVQRIKNKHKKELLDRKKNQVILRRERCPAIR